MQVVHCMKLKPLKNTHGDNKPSLANTSKSRFGEKNAKNTETVVKKVNKISTLLHNNRLIHMKHLRTLPQKQFHATQESFMQHPGDEFASRPRRAIF